MEEKKIKVPHSVFIDDRKFIKFTGITDVGSFDDENITLFSDYGEITVKGENLQITELSVEKGDFSATGEICSVVYSGKTQKQSGLFAKLFG